MPSPGVNPGGSGTYRGTVNVTSTGDAYEVTWRIGGTRYTGIGVYTSGVLSIAYYGSNLSLVLPFIRNRPTVHGAATGRCTASGAARQGELGFPR